MGIFEDLFDKAKSFFGEGSEEVQVQKRCYYELLEVERDATEDEIKRSYKRLALKLHPDKTLDRKEECTALFILVQQAYEVLTDPQERAFYDKHRENIIRGSSAEERKDTGINLYKFFQKCYSGFEDDQDGFFSIYRQLFDTLASEEFPYIEDDEDKDFPSFGTSTSDYDQIVAPFYDHWLYFSTQRSFAWLDRYDLRNAEDRYTLKCMDKENHKYRDAGKKQRNEEIRNLVQYMRRRDPRVKVHREQLEERRKKEFERVGLERQKQIMKNIQKFDEQDGTAYLNDDDYLNQLDQIETELDEQFGVFAIDDNGEEDPNSYHCIACEKNFKTSKSFSNHQKTNKHKKAVDELKKLMAKDDELLNEEEEEDQNEQEEVVVSEAEQPDESEVPKQQRKKKKNAKAKNNKSNELDDDGASNSANDVIDVVEELAQKVKKLKKEKRGQLAEEKKANATEGSTAPIESTCMICNESFPSRSKLFDHIKVTGHAALKDTKQTKKKKR